MAENLKSISTFPHHHNFNAGTTLTEIILPLGIANTVTIGSDAAALFVCTNGGSDGGSVPTHKAFVPQSQYLAYTVGYGDANQQSSIYVATQSGSGKEVSIILTQGER